MAKTMLVGNVIGVTCKEKRMKVLIEQYIYIYIYIIIFNSAIRIINYIPVCPPDSPRVPRGCTFNTSHLALRPSMLSFVHPGKSTWTEALIPVPRLVGQEWI